MAKQHCPGGPIGGHYVQDGTPDNTIIEGDKRCPEHPEPAPAATKTVVKDEGKKK